MQQAFVFLLRLNPALRNAAFTSQVLPSCWCWMRSRLQRWHVQSCPLGCPIGSMGHSCPQGKRTACEGWFGQADESNDGQQHRLAG